MGTHSTPINTDKLLWLVYLALLAVLLPHTAWAFSNFEPKGAGAFGIWWGEVTAWAAAFAFEAAIATLTHKLAKHIEKTPRYTSGHVQWRRFRFRYFNAYAAGLAMAVGVSTLANLAHAVEFGGTIAIFGRYHVPFGIYAIAFGAILPFTSLLFARVLSNVAELEQEANPDLEQAKATIRDLHRQLREAEGRIQVAEQRANAAEIRFAAAGDMFAKLFAEEKRDRILAARQAWPQLPGSAIAIIAEASPSYVSEVLKDEPHDSE
jgi:hypothetical protein